MRSIILVIFTVFFNLIIFAQTNLVYRVVGKITNSETKKSEAGVTITILNNGKVVGTAVTSTNGKYDMRAEAPLGTNLQITYSKPGFVTKKVSFNGTSMKEEDIPAGTEFPLPPLDMELFTERPNADFSFLNNEPVASFFWDPNKMMLDYDRDASSKVRKKIDDLLAQQDKNAADLEAKYQSTINNAQSLYIQKKYEEALVKYEEASKLKPNETLPQTKIAELVKLISAQKAQAMASQKLDGEYQNLVTAADNLRNQKKYEEAILKYKEALSKKDESYPKDEITKLTKLIADQNAEAAKNAQFESLKKDGFDLMTQKKWSEAKAKFVAANAIKQDATLTQKIKEIDAEIEKEKQNASKKQQYDLAIKTADNLFSSGKFEEAKTKYTEASTIDPTQSYPKDKLTQISTELAKLQKQNELKLKVDKLLAEGSTAFTAKNLELAKAKYEEVLKLESSNTVASEKLKVINQQMNAQKNEAEKEQLFNQLKKEGFDLASNKKYNDAKLKLEQAITIKNDIQISQKIIEINKLIDEENKKLGLDNQYNKVIQDAKSFELDKNYQAAIEKYKVASSLKPTETLPKQKITELQKLLKDASQNTLNEKNYATYVANGDKFLLVKNFDQAITEYEKALGVKPNDSYAQSKISEAKQLKDNLLKSQSADAEKQKQFDAYMAEADKLFRQKKYLDAKNQYNNALGIKPSDSKATKQRDECIRLEQEISNGEEEAGYRKLLSVADKKLAAKDYDKAIEYYQRALTIRANDPYPKAKLDEINRLKNPQVQQPVVAKAEPVEPEKLKPLGEVYEKSEKDAMDDLRKAEIERKRLQEKKLEGGVNEVLAQSEEKENQKKDESRETSQEVFNLKGEIDAENQSKKEDFQAAVEASKKVKKQQEDFNDLSNVYENTDRLSIQEKADLIKVENDSESSDKISLYKDKTAEIKKYQTKLLNNSEEDYLESHNEKIEDIDQIKKVGDKIELEQIQNNAEKIETDQKIIQTTKNNIQEVESTTDMKIKTTLAAQISIDIADKEQDKIMIKDEAEASELAVDLKDIKDKVQLSSDLDFERKQNEGQDDTQSIVELNQKIEGEKKSNDESLRSSSENLRKGNKDLYDKSNDNYNSEKSKYLENQGGIGKKLTKIEEDTQFSNEKNVESGTALKDKTNELIDNSAQQAFDKEQNLIDAQQTINKTNQELAQDKVLQPNALGQEYEEGVTQETFNQNDENGLMKAIITRRIVVIDGHGDVYVRTQTSSATTYSKNGEPSSERVWQKETQGPQLKKNF